MLAYAALASVTVLEESVAGSESARPCEFIPAPSEYPPSAHPELDNPASPALSRQSCMSQMRVSYYQPYSLESMFIIPPEPLTRPPVAVPLFPDEALPPVAPLPPAAQPVSDVPPVPALFELTFMRVGMPPLSPESTLPPSTAPAVPV